MGASSFDPNSFAFRYLLTISAASISETVTYPLDLIKTRLQIQRSTSSFLHRKNNIASVSDHAAAGGGTGSRTVNTNTSTTTTNSSLTAASSPCHSVSSHNKLGPHSSPVGANRTVSFKTTLAVITAHNGMFSTGLEIAKKEGVLKLWSGLPPALYRHMIYSGFRIMSYEKFRSMLGRDKDGTFALWKSCVAGMTAGAMGQFLASPTDLVKVQMQCEGKRRLQGKAPRVKNSLHALRVIVSEGGLFGLWRGWLPNCQRAALVNIGELATYDKAKRLLLNKFSMGDNAITHAIASAASGLVAASVGTPADVIKTRIMNQPVDSSGRPLVYKGMIDCLMKTVNKEGVLALWKGFIPIWTRMAPWSLVFWVSYEKIRYMTGVASF